MFSAMNGAVRAGRLMNNLGLLSKYSTGPLSTNPLSRHPLSILIRVLNTIPWPFPHKIPLLLGPGIVVM